MNTKTMVALLTFIGGSLPAACGKAKREKIQKEAQTTMELRNKWQGTCRPAPDLPEQFAISQWDFGADRGYTQRDMLHSDANCQTKTFTRTTRGTYELPNNRNQGTNDIDLMVKDLIITPDSADWVKKMNEGKDCQHTDWQAGVEQSVTGRDCPEGKIDRDTRIRDIYDIRDGKLYFGRRAFAVVGPAFDQRPTSVDTGTSYSQ